MAFAALTVSLAGCAVTGPPPPTASPVLETEASPASSGAPQDTDWVIDSDDPELDEKKTLIVPFVFYSDLFDLAGGVAFARQDFPQEDATTVGTLMGGSNGSVLFTIITADMQTGIADRLLADAFVSLGTFAEQEIYAGTDPRFPDERRGSNDSDEDNFAEGDGEDIHLRLHLKYVLPWGSGEEEIRHQPILDRGILVGNPSGGGPWNPLRSGRTFVELEPFYRNQTVDIDSEDIEQRTNGLKLSVTHDNTDLPENPSRGSRQRLSVVRDFGWFDSSDSWTAMEFHLSKFVDLGATDMWRQRTLASNVWGAHSFTWREEETADGIEITGRPPSFEGARLGGLMRLRAFPSARFSDRYALIYQTEYRFIPQTNPLDSLPLLSRLGSDRLQYAVFAELGRVADSVDDLHSSMKWDAGVGVRLLLQGVVARIDVGFCDEGPAVQVMVGHSF